MILTFENVGKSYGERPRARRTLVRGRSRRDRRRARAQRRRQNDRARYRARTAPPDTGTVRLFGAIAARRFGPAPRSGRRRKTADFPTRCASTRSSNLLRRISAGRAARSPERSRTSAWRSSPSVAPGRCRAANRAGSRWRWLSPETPSLRTRRADDRPRRRVAAALVGRGPQRRGGARDSVQHPLLRGSRSDGVAHRRDRSRTGALRRRCARPARALRHAAPLLRRRERPHGGGDQRHGRIRSRVGAMPARRFPISKSLRPRSKRRFFPSREARNDVRWRWCARTRGSRCSIYSVRRATSCRRSSFRRCSSRCSICRSRARRPRLQTTLTLAFIAWAIVGVAVYQFGVGIAQERGRPWERYLRTLPVSTGVRFAARILCAAVFGALAAAVRRARRARLYAGRSHGTAVAAGSLLCVRGPAFRSCCSGSPSDTGRRRAPPCRSRPPAIFCSRMPADCGCRRGISRPSPPRSRRGCRRDSSPRSCGASRAVRFRPMPL